MSGIEFSTLLPTTSNTLGATFFGVIAASVMFGITSIMVFLYYHHFHNDFLLHKIAVTLLWAFDTFHHALTLHAVYYYTIRNFGNLDASTSIVWSLKVQVLVNVIIILLVQSLYAHRVWRLGGFHAFGAMNIVKYMVWVAIAFGFCLGLILAYQTFRSSTFSELEHVGITWAVSASLAGATAIDIFLALCMCWYLHLSTGLESILDSRIGAVIVYTLGSGALTSFGSVAALVAYIFLPNTFVYLSIEFLLTKLYVGSFVAMLNGRRQHRAQLYDSPVVVTSLQFQRTDPESHGNNRARSHHLSEYRSSSFEGWDGQSEAIDNKSNLVKKDSLFGLNAPWADVECNVPVHEDVHPPRLDRMAKLTEDDRYTCPARHKPRVRRATADDVPVLSSPLHSLPQSDPLVSGDALHQTPLSTAATSPGSLHSFPSSPTVVASLEAAYLPASRSSQYSPASDGQPSLPSSSTTRLGLAL